MHGHRTYLLSSDSMKSSPPRPVLPSAALLVLYAVSGFCILTLEMVWMREVSFRVGNTVVAATMVFSVFFYCGCIGQLARSRRLPAGQAAPFVIRKF